MAHSDPKLHPDAPPEGGANGAPILEMQDVHKSFGPLRVLQGISLAVDTGKTLVILGASGSGKSVTLKLLIGLLRPDHGQVYFHGRRIDSLPERELVKIRTHMGFVFQMGALFDSLSVAENIAFPLREHSDYNDSHILDIVRAKLRSVGLEDVRAEVPDGIVRRAAQARGHRPGAGDRPGGRVPGRADHRAGPDTGRRDERTGDQTARSSSV